MTRAYRESAVSCPACDALMRVDLTTSAAVEVCDACEGMWIDWFEGELQAIAAAHEAERVSRGTPLPSRPTQPPSGSRHCPRCQQALVAELYRFSDAKDGDLIEGIELLRCAECGGAFVPRGSAHLLLDHVCETKTQSPWEALLGFLQRVFARPQNPG